VHDFLLKPIDEKELKRSIEKQVGELEAIRRRREESQTVSRTKGVRQQMELERFMRLLISAKPEAKENLPAFLEELENGFPRFLDNAKGDLKAEYLLPRVIDSLIQEGKAQVKVLKTQDKWFGVTYQEDKAAVVAAIRRLIDQGVYREKLF
jgi:YesN/AraC family two-component response regulator